LNCTDGQISSRVPLRKCVKMKIPSLPPQTPAADTVETVRDSVESASSSAAAQTTEAVSAAAADPTAQIAADAAAGKISRQEAVDRILADVLDSPMVDAVPDAVRADLENALRTLIAEDPHLISLCAAISPNEIK
jgi:hypothetical protein